MPLVALPKVRISKRGSGVQINMSNTGVLIKGEGTALADTIIEQDAAYWEVLILEAAGQFKVGVARDLNGMFLDSQIGDGDASWAVGSNTVTFEKGDVVGVAFGQDSLPNLKFYRNGVIIDEASVNKVKGEVYPAFSLREGVQLEVRFESEIFSNEVPGRYTAILPPRKML